MEEKDYNSYTPHTEDNSEEGVENDQDPDLSSPQYQNISNPNTPCTQGSATYDPVTPNTASTPASLSVTDDTDGSHFSISLDSGIESPHGYPLHTGHYPNLVHGPNSNMRSIKQKSSPASKAADHTNKEKLRRERIKESCDQLRVLLPYIRGRKTDMASVLEMCVEYLRIVNAFMPQTLQEQIVDILSKETAQGVPSKGKGNKAGLTPKEEISHQITSSLQHTDSFAENNSEFTLTCSDTLITCDVNNNCTEEKGSKRIRLQDGSATVSHFEQQIDHTVTCHTDSVPTYSFHGSQMGGIHMEDQSYGRMYSDGYSTAQQIYNNYTNNKNLQLEPDYMRPTYLDSYHYYPNIINTPIPPARIYSSPSEYVNPNAVLQTLPYSSVLLKQPVAGNLKVDVFCTSNTVDQQKDDEASATL